MSESTSLVQPKILIDTSVRKLPTSEIGRLTIQEAKRSVRHPIAAVVEDVRSIHNVGSMFRTADAAGLSHLHLTGITGTPENRMMRKAALGAEDVVQWTKHASGPHAIENLKSIGYSIAALEITDMPTPIGSLKMLDYPIALVVGNEVTGVSDETLALCDFSIEIEQFGAKHSLNVSVAFGIAVYRLVGQYRRLESHD